MFRVEVEVSLRRLKYERKGSVELQEQAARLLQHLQWTRTRFPDHGCKVFILTETIRELLAERERLGWPFLAGPPLEPAATPRPPRVFGIASTCRSGRDGGDVVVRVRSGRVWREYTLPWFFVRDVDAHLQRSRREEHEALLLSMNGGRLNNTLRLVAEKGGVLDTKFLLERGAVVDDEGRFPLLELAAYNGHVSVVEVLMDATGTGSQIDVLACALDGVPRNGTDGAAMMALLIDRGANVHSFNERALMHAVKHGCLAMARVLLDRGTDVGAQANAPLLAAARQGDLEMVRLLIDGGADVHAQEEGALREARGGGHEAVVALLLERGAIADADADEEE